MDHLEHAFPHDDQLMRFTKLRGLLGEASPIGCCSAKELDMKTMKMRALLGALVLGLVAGCASKAQMDFKTTDVACTGLGQNWTMPDSRGQLRSPDQFKGKITYLFFGFTRCPDVCPMTMADIAQVKHLMGSDAKNLQVLFVTVDPARDTPATVGQYIRAFDPGAIALVGNDQQLASMASDFKVFYRREVMGDGQNYMMSHTAGGYIFDKRGKLRLFAKSGTPVQDLFSDIQRLSLEPVASVNTRAIAAHCSTASMVAASAPSDAVSAGDHAQIAH